ncbi:carbohydrate ABC transporter permease [Alicyclobacillus fastidiosus]|uniref:Sugar ABC transporter permease n=1 Tax=Alicyclobacillus fastidiosus TaxID=392011 RepID=A0ABV5AB69_9BACL|nr:sugar ABC transporter permease [Alicyclobacillus fastidiosus]WEH10506.1 sugar ABC transporter permease [Alicyclobacillus fastidiosus]
MGSGMNWQRWLMIVPAVVFFAVFALFPMLMAVYYSGLTWNGIGSAKWVGLLNWGNVFHDGEALHAIVLTVEVMVLSWVFQTPISLLLGVFLAGRQKHRAVLGVFYFVPLLFSSVAIGVTWSYMLNPNFGLVDALLKSLHIGNGNQNWLGNTHLALLVVSMIIAWQFIPFHSLLYQGGVKQIPDSLYEAATIDGASVWSSFFSITLPQLKYTIITSSVLILTGSLTYFDLIYVLTDGGPGNATTVLAMDMYKQAFVNQNIGLGSVLAVILAVAGVLLSILTLRFTGFNRMESQLEGM